MQAATIYTTNYTLNLVKCQADFVHTKSAFMLKRAAMML